VEEGEGGRGKERRERVIEITIAGSRIIAGRVQPERK
jgi:hypothetical protein